MTKPATKNAAGIFFCDDPNNRLVDEHETAARLGLTVATLRRWRWARRGLPWVKVGSAVRYQPDDINSFINAGRVSPLQGVDAGKAA